MGASASHSQDSQGLVQHEQIQKEAVTGWLPLPKVKVKEHLAKTETFINAVEALHVARAVEHSHYLLLSQAHQQGVTSEAEQWDFSRCSNGMPASQVAI